jgi:hypothetical protein
MDLKKLTQTIENANTIAKENGQLKKQNQSLLSRIKSLEDEIDGLNKELKREKYRQFITDFESNPSSFLDLPTKEILSNEILVYWYFKPIKKYMEWSNTLRDFFETPDNELLKYRTLGEEKLKKIRLIQKMIYDNSLERGILF